MTSPSSDANSRQETQPRRIARISAGVCTLWLVLSASVVPAAAQQSDEAVPLDTTTEHTIKALYRGLIDAENQHDIEAVRPLSGTRPRPCSSQRPRLPQKADGRVSGARRPYSSISRTFTKAHSRSIRTMREKRNRAISGRGSNLCAGQDYGRVRGPDAAAEAVSDDPRMGTNAIRMEDGDRHRIADSLLACRQSKRRERFWTIDALLETGVVDHRTKRSDMASMNVGRKRVVTKLLECIGPRQVEQAECNTALLAAYRDKGLGDEVVERIDGLQGIEILVRDD